MRLSAPDGIRGRTVLPAPCHGGNLDLLSWFRCLARKPCRLIASRASLPSPRSATSSCIPGSASRISRRCPVVLSLISTRTGRPLLHRRRSRPRDVRPARRAWSRQLLQDYGWRRLTSSPRIWCPKARTPDQRRRVVRMTSVSRWHAKLLNSTWSR